VFTTATFMNAFFPRAIHGTGSLWRVRAQCPVAVFAAGVRAAGSAWCAMEVAFVSAPFNPKRSYVHVREVRSRRPTIRTGSGGTGQVMVARIRQWRGVHPARASKTLIPRW